MNTNTNMTECRLFQANLTEPAVPEDPTSNDTTVVPTFNGYSANGTVTSGLVCSSLAPIVEFLLISFQIYANYGRLEDFQYLISQGVKINGSIIIVRYGAIFRGVKAMLAQQYHHTSFIHASSLTITDSVLRDC